MKNIKKRLIGWTLGLALSLGVGIGIASNTHSEISGVEAATGETKTLIIDGSKLPSKATTADSTIKYGDFDITFSKGAKSQAASGTNKFAGTEDAILIGKKGAYIYNVAPIGSKITKFEIYANKGASQKVAVGVNFSAEKIAKYNASSANTFAPVLSSLDHVYDASDKLPLNATYFWYQVTNANNSQVMFRITYESLALESVSVETPPTKVSYYAGDKFDPTGLIVKKTFGNGTTENLPYKDNEDKFEFHPSLTDELKETDKAIAITVGGKTVNLPITVKQARAITSVTLDGDMTKKAYYEDDAWDVSGLYLTVNWNEGEPTIIQLTDLKVETDYHLDSDVAAIGTTSLHITGTYNEFGFGKTIEGLTVTERPNTVKIAYEAAGSLELTGTTSDSYEFSGVVVGTIGNSFFVQDRGYGMYVYNNAVSGLAVGKRIDIKSTLQTYSGAIETLAVSSATLGKEAVMPVAATISSAADLKALKQNVLVDLEAVMPATLGDWAPGQKGAHALNTLTVGTDEIVMKFDKFAYNKSSVSGIYSSLAGKKVSIKNAVSSAHDTFEANQLLLTEQTTIEVIKDDYNDALAFGTSFLNKTVEACTDGTKDNSEALKTAWATLNTEFNALSDGAKKFVKGAVANNAGTDLEKAMARYDHIVKRYSAAHTEISDFIGRGVTASLTNQLFKANTTNNIMVISLIACASVAAIGSFFFIRKRKEQN